MYLSRFFSYGVMIYMRISHNTALRMKDIIRKLLYYPIQGGMEGDQVIYALHDGQLILTVFHGGHTYIHYNSICFPR